MSRLLPGEHPARAGIREFEEFKLMEDEYLNLEGAEDYDIVMYDNSTITARQPDEGSLLVRRAPCLIRPPSDTGVAYNVETRTVRLDDPPNAGLYSWDAFRMETPHEVCQACKDAFNYYCQYRETRWSGSKDGKKPSMSNTVVHHFNLWSLVAFAKSGKCFLCTQLLESLERRFPEALDPDNIDKFHTEMCWVQVIGREEKDTLYFVLTDPATKRDTWNPSHFFRLNLWPRETYEHYFKPLPTARPRAEGPPEIAESTDSPMSRTLAVEWLAQCRANENGKHDICNMPKSSTLPTRLLDLKHCRKTGQLRLILPAADPSLFAGNNDFITLSHCWGEWGARRNPLLTQDNLADRQATGLPLDGLPKTFRDAIQVAYWFRVRWIWIDCLCIVQDSLDDWSYEASMMAQVYKNALLNISADSFPDSRGGCFVDRDVLGVVPPMMHAPELAQSWFVTPTPVHLFDWMSRATSFSRAWISRERQLAKRILHFTEIQIVWECCGSDGAGFASETFPGGGSFEATFRRDNKYQINGLRQGRNENTAEVYATWNDVCENLSTNQLTKPTDMPVVLSSLAEEFAAMLPEDQYMSGLWQSTLPESLLWDSRAFRHDNKDGYIAPSWSWLSSACAVKLNHRWAPRQWQRNAVVTVEDILIKLKYESQPLGPVDSGTITLRGCLRRIRLHIAENGFELSVYDDSDDSEQPRYIGKDWDEYFGDLCHLEMDSQLETAYLECFCLFVTIKQWGGGGPLGSHRDIECLLLQSTESEGTFQRIGTLELKDHYALKMRYKVNPGIREDTERWKALQASIQNAQDIVIRARKEGEEAGQREREERDAEWSDLEGSEAEDSENAGREVAERQLGAEGCLEAEDRSEAGRSEEEGCEDTGRSEDAERNGSGSMQGKEGIEEGRKHIAATYSTKKRNPDPALLYQFDEGADTAWLEPLTPQTVVIV